MSITTALSDFKNKIIELKQAQATMNGGRKTPIYISMDSFALYLGWLWNSNGTAISLGNEADMKEFFTYYVPVIEELGVKIYSYLPVSTFDNYNKANFDHNSLVFGHQRFPTTTTHTFGGQTFEYDFRQIAQCNAEDPWLSMLQLDHWEAYTLFGRSTTRLDDLKKMYTTTSSGGNSWSRFMHEIARQKLAGYHTNPNYTFSSGFVSAMSAYTYSASDSNFSTVVAGRDSATLEDVLQTVVLFWRDCVNYLKGSAVVGGNGASVTISKPFKQVNHYANCVGALYSTLGIPAARTRGIRPYNTSSILYRNYSDNRVYYNKSFYRSTFTDDGPAAIDKPAYKNNDSGFANTTYTASLLGDPTAISRLYPNTTATPTADRTIYGYYLSGKVGTVKNFIAAQSNADSYGTNLYFFHGVGSEWKDLIEGGIRHSSISGSTPAVKCVSSSTTANESTMTLGQNTIVGQLNDVSVCSGIISSGHPDTYEDLMYWIGVTLSMHCSQSRQQILRNLDYNKAYLTGIANTNPTTQTQELQKLAKKPICAILASTPSDLTDFSTFGRTHMFMCWPKNVSEFVSAAVTPLFYKGDKNGPFVSSPDEIMFWNSSWFYNISQPCQQYGSTYNADRNSTVNGIPRWIILGNRLGWEKLVFGRAKVTEGEKCAMNHVNSGATTFNEVKSYEWLYNNTLSDTFWFNSSTAWYTPAGGTNTAILSAGLQPLNATTHELYPYLSGAFPEDTTNYYNGTITLTQIKKALGRYQSKWVLEMLKELRNQLDAIGA